MFAGAVNYPLGGGASPLSVTVGDFNFDGSVNAADYTVWRDELETTFSQDDYEQWKVHFGESVGQGADSTVTVPESSSLCLMLAAFAGSWFLSRP